MLKNSITVLTCGVLLLGTSTIALAQENATLSGAVADSSGALIPGAEVTVTNDATGEVATSLTDGIGEYEFSLQPGIYTLTVELPGFETEIASNLELGAGQPILRNFVLEVGGITRLLWSGRARSPAR